jgi:hypothetical protein
VAFSRSHRQPGYPDEPQRRDRHAIVGLSGWLFADLLLAVAVIFLVAETIPQFAEEESEEVVKAAVGVPVANLSFEPELPVGEAEGLPVWRQVDAEESGDSTVGISVIFSEPVSGFGGSLEQIAKDIGISATIDGEKFQGSGTGWSVKSLIAKAGGKTYQILLEPSIGFQSATVEVVINQRAVLDEDGNPNPSSQPLIFLVQRQPETVIDTKKASQIRVAVSGQSCAASSEIEVSNLVSAIERVGEFDINVATTGESRETLRKNFVSWVESAEGFGSGAKVGFVFIYGSGKNGVRIAENWTECVVQAITNLGWLGDSDAASIQLPVKQFKADGITTKQLQLELYFFSSVSEPD